MNDPYDGEWHRWHGGTKPPVSNGTYVDATTARKKGGKVTVRNVISSAVLWSDVIAYRVAGED